VVDAALKSTNPKSDLATKVSVGWNLNLVQGAPMFIGVIHIGVDTKEMDRHEDRWAGVVSGMHLVQ
jgi:sensor domain CHASE-containing protein